MFVKAKLAKQNTLMAYLDSKNLKGTSTDIVINNGECGKERPDRVFELDDKVIILECDEHQHKDRQCDCEQTRMINISQSFGGLPVYFIRWNPDDYIPGKNCRDQESLIKRHKLVSDYIDNIINNTLTIPNALVSVLYMYYDNWNGIENEKWNVLISYES